MYASAFMSYIKDAVMCKVGDASAVTPLLFIMLTTY